MPSPKNRTPLQASMRKKIAELNDKIKAAKATGGTQSNRRIREWEQRRASYQDTLRRSVNAVARSDERRRSRRLGTGG